MNNIWLVRNTAGNDWGSTRLHDAISLNGAFQSPQVDTRTWWERDADQDIQSWGSAATTYFTINQGNVGIGIINPQNKLDVNGTIHSKQVKVDLTGWADYVFKPTYHLPTLAEIKTYIDKNHHLPDMPSEAEIAKDGVNLGEMNKVLVKKVEELTLYLIEKDKIQIEQKEVNRKQSAQLKLQQEQIDKLSQQLEYLIKISQKR